MIRSSIWHQLSYISRASLGHFVLHLYHRRDRQRPLLLLIHQKPLCICFPHPLLLPKLPLYFEHPVGFARSQTIHVELVPLRLLCRDCVQARLWPRWW